MLTVFGIGIAIACAFPRLRQRIMQLRYSFLVSRFSLSFGGASSQLMHAIWLPARAIRIGMTAEKKFPAIL